ncbi:MAG: hypothetical protein HYT76_04130, partial [Deltaproteobacteria bacterium]|nr:hypothetical protein [Deltaproteobacteria bacterium]
GGEAEYNDYDDPIEEDDLIGRCDLELNWGFSQDLTIEPKPANAGFLLNATGPAVGTRRDDLSFPWADKIKLETYRDPTTGEWPSSCHDDEGVGTENLEKTSLSGTKSGSGKKKNGKGSKGSNSSSDSKLVVPVLDLGAITRNQGVLGTVPSSVFNRAAWRSWEEYAQDLIGITKRNSVSSAEVTSAPAADSNRVREYKLTGLHDRNRKHDTCNRYKLTVWQFGWQRDYPPDGYLPRQKTVDLRYRSEFKVADEETIMERSNFVTGWDDWYFAAFEGEDIPTPDDLDRDPDHRDAILQDERTYMIPLKAQHLAPTNPIEIELLYYGCTDGCLKELKVENLLLINGTIYDYYIPARQGWIDQTSSADQDVVYAFQGGPDATVEEEDGDREINWGSGIENRTPNPRLDSSFSSSKYTYQGNLEAAFDGDPTNAVDTRQVPLIQYLLKTRFRALKFKITAHGIDGEDRVVYRELVPRYNSRFVRPDYMFVEPGYWDPFREVTVIQFLINRGDDGNLFNYRLPHCTITTDCPNNCTDLNGDLPCFECQTDGICRAREWEDNSMELQLGRAFGRLGNRNR